MRIRLRIGRPLAYALLSGLWACAAVEQLAPIADGYDQCGDRGRWEAELLQRRAEESQARAFLIETIGRCPDFVPAHLALTELGRAEDGTPNPAVVEFYAGWKGRPGSPLPEFVRARLARNDRDRLEALESAIARDASFYYAYLDLAEVWERSDRIAKVVDAYDKASRAKPDSWRAQLGLARALAQIGRAEDAAGAYAKALEGMPSAEPGFATAAREYAAMLVYELRRPAAAALWLDRLLANRPDEIGLLMDRAAAYWLAGERDRAVSLYRRVLELEPKEARAALNIGNLFFERPERSLEEKRRDWPSARRAYRYFLAHAEDGDDYDVTDRVVTVPLRLRLIDEALGALPPGSPVPKVGEL